MQVLLCEQWFLKAGHYASMGNCEQPSSNRLLYHRACAFT